MKIQVIGTGCDKCEKLYNNTKDALAQLGVAAEVEKVEDLLEIVKLGVMTTPSLMVNGKLIVSGQVLKADKIADKMKAHLVV